MEPNVTSQYHVDGPISEGTNIGMDRDNLHDVGNDRLGIDKRYHCYATHTIENWCFTNTPIVK